MVEKICDLVNKLNVKLQHIKHITATAKRISPNFHLGQDRLHTVYIHSDYHLTTHSQFLVSWMRHGGT
jgi:hypothetical protein